MVVNTKGFELESEALLAEALDLAYLRKVKSMRAAGRKMSNRAVSQWWRSKAFTKEIVSIVTLCARKAEKITFKKSGNKFETHYCAFFRHHLSQERAKLLRDSGRPKKQIGFIAEVRARADASKKLPGRPARMTLAQEKSWAQRILGSVCRLYADKNGIRTIEKLYQLIASNQLDMNDLNSARLEAKAIERSERQRCIEQSEQFDQSRLPALRVRYSRSKKLFSLNLPIGKK